jgi:hypothetical protein
MYYNVIFIAKMRCFKLNKIELTKKTEKFGFRKCLEGLPVIKWAIK